MYSKMLLIILISLFIYPNYIKETLPSASDLIVFQISKNVPEIKKIDARNLAELIVNVGNLYGITPMRLAAILAQESRYKLDAINHVSKDYGIAQINHRTVEAFGFDKKKLLTNLEYSVKAGAIVLSDLKKRWGHKEKDYWTRYNSSNPDKREAYKRLVMRFM